MESGRRRLRSCLASTAPGGRGSPTVPTMRDCPQGLHAGRMKAEKSAGSGCDTSRRPSPEVTVPRTEIAAVERRKARALRKARAVMHQRRQAPHDGCYQDSAFRRSASLGGSPIRRLRRWGLLGNIDDGMRITCGHRADRLDLRGYGMTSQWRRRLCFRRDRFQTAKPCGQGGISATRLSDFEVYAVFTLLRDP